MRDVRVIAIEVATPGRRDDPHPFALQLADGRQISAARVITNLRYGIEAYHVEEADGDRIGVRSVGPCPRCGLAYLRADRGGTTHDRLMRLPKAPFGPQLLSGR